MAAPRDGKPQESTDYGLSDDNFKSEGGLGFQTALLLTLYYIN